MQPLLQLCRKLKHLVIPIYLDCLPRGIENDLTMAARGGMGANLLEELRTDLAVEVVGEFAQEIGAGHTV
jgi:hypothetical protein